MPSFHNLHCIISLTIHLTAFIHRHQIRVIQRRHGLHLRTKPPRRRLSRQHRRRHHLQRHFAPQTSVPRTIHHPHPPASRHTDQFVFPELPQSWHLLRLSRFSTPAQR